NFASLAAPARKASCPVDKLSHPTTAIPSASKRSQRLLPINPAAPVTNAFLIGEHCLLFNLSSPFCFCAPLPTFSDHCSDRKIATECPPGGALLATPSADGPNGRSTAIGDNPAKELQAAPLQSPKALRFARLRQA